MVRDRVLVTGAGGFIGGRLVEVMHQLGVPVRGGVRRWSSAVRIGRLPIELVQCDVAGPESIRASMRGVAYVVHCARGDPFVNVEGTRLVLAEANRAGVKRVVFLSSVAVYGSLDGQVTETSPSRPGSNAYASSKLAAEAVCREYVRQGLSVAILRPTIVYGPFSGLWTLEFAERMAAGSWLIPSRYSQGICNLLFVDDLAKAVLLCFEKDEASGQTFIVNGSERPTWGEYFQALNNALGLPPLRPVSAGRSRFVAAVMAPVRKSAKLILRHFQPLVLAAYKRSTVAKALLRRAESTIRNAPSGAEFELYSLRVSYEAKKASEVLGFRPAFTMHEGIQLSVAWLRHHGYM